MDNRKLYVKTNGNISIVDPNKYSDGNDGYVDRYVNHEDLVMYVKLMVYGNNKTNITTGGDPIKIDNIETTNINFLDTTNRGSLTTSWTTMFEPSRPYESESFGISNIKIEYNASYIPTVTIEFLDIRGKTLFARGDDPKNPYNMFFQFPYPQFSLIVKGYYGRAVTIPLILEKANTNFDGQSGDYRTTATFRSFTFALLNDIPLRYLIQAPYMYEIPLSSNKKGYEGMQILVSILKRYYNEMGVDLCQFANNGSDDDFMYYHNKYPITIPDFLFKIKNLEADVVQTPEISAQINRHEEVTRTKEALGRFETELRRDLIQAGFIQTGNTYIYNKNDQSIDDLFQQIYDLLDINVFQSLSTNIDGYNYQNEVGKLFNSPTALGFVISQDTSQPITVNISNVIVQLSDKFLKQVDEISLDAINDLTELIRKSAANRLGFEPTLKNVVMLFLANLETFLTLLTKKSLLAYNDTKKRADELKTIQNKGGFIENFDTYYANNENIVYPWPDFFVKDKKTDEMIKSFPGDHFEFRDREEIKFINELIASVIRLQEDTGNRSTFEEDNRPVINYTPISPEDVPAMFLSNNNKLTLDYFGATTDGDLNYFFNPEGDKNSGQFKLADGKVLSKPTYTAALLLTKVIESAVYLGISSVTPNQTTKQKFSGVNTFASEMGEAHGNNLYNSLGGKSPISVYLVKLLTKGLKDENINFFQEFFVNQRSRDEELDEKPDDVERIQSVIQDRYQNIFRNTSLFSQFHKFKQMPTITEFGDSNITKEQFGRNGNPVQMYPGYNTNIKTFQKINLNENYQKNRKNNNENSLSDEAISQVKQMGDGSVDNFYLINDPFLIKNKSLYGSDSELNNFNTDNSMPLRKLYIGSMADGSKENRQSFMREKFFAQDVSDEDDYKISFRRYQALFTKERGEVLNIEISSIVPPSVGEENIDVRVKSILDTISAYEGGFDVSNATHRGLDKDCGYSRYSSGTIPTSGSNLVQFKKNIGNIMSNWKNGQNDLHPNIIVQSGSISSTAAGRYQFIYSTWVDEISQKEFDMSHLPLTKINQDKGALYLAFKQTTSNKPNGTKYKKADKVGLLKNNSIKELFESLASCWAFIPGYHGQSRVSLNDIFEKYQKILAYNIENNLTLDKDVLDYLNTIII